MSSDDLTTQLLRIRSATLVAAHLASQLDDVRSLPPLGYTPDRPFDGTPRPVEDTVIALDSRNIPSDYAYARRDLALASLAVERAARTIDRALRSWEGTTANVT